LTIQKIVRMGNPTLRQVAIPYPVDEIGSPAFQTLIQDMQDTLHAYGGIGLAAPQMGVSYQVIVIEIGNTSTRYGELDQVSFSVFVNPTVSVADETTAGYWEGCLSLPGFMGYVDRPQHIQVNCLDEKGNTLSVEYEGFLSTVFQHEFDHLMGKLYIDRMKNLTQFSFDEEYQKFHADSS